MARLQTLMLLTSTWAFSAVVLSLFPSFGFSFEQRAHPKLSFTNIRTSHDRREERPSFALAERRAGSTRLYMSANGGDGDKDSFREMLEGSWNYETMGSVPSTPEKAAEAAASAIGEAVRNGSNLLMVNIQLPSYDITLGSNYYDEILVVQFCIALSKRMKEDNLVENSAILLRDGKAERSVVRVLEIKENQKAEEETAAMDGKNFQQSDDEGNSDLDGAVDDDLDSYRKKIALEWDGEKSEAVTEDEPSTISNAQESYRIGSLFGDEHVSLGPDMFDDVLAAVDKNAVRKTDDAIIVLSSFTDEEMIAVRRIAAVHEGTMKRVIFVNCKLDPLPRELAMAETAYSILPLIAREKNPDQPTDDKGPQPPKIVVIRRYPRNWEAYVDADGRGFELADSMSAERAGKRGPPFEWIAGCVKRHMELKFGK